MAIASDSGRHSADLAAIAAALADDYLVECEIGRGGMGVVYRARDIRLDRLVAVKVLPPHLAGVEDVRERFLREARTAARLAHPNIVPIHRADEVGGYVFFVMGLVQGESLAERLRTRGPLAPADALPLLADVSRALAYAHAHGVVHRDIKPENILIDAASGRAMVTDFGIARLAEASPLTATGQVLGTVYFMSPEQVANDALDGRSDLYSLGVVGFVALSGRYPFDGATASAVLVAHVTKVAPRLQDVAPQIPDAVARIIDRCLLRDPAARFPDGDSLARAFDDARSDVAVQRAPAATREVLSEREAMAVWQRAAELQALTSAAPAVTPLEQIEAARSRTQGYRIDHVRDAAVEAGISEPYVERAVRELGFAGPLPARVHAVGGLTETPATDPMLDPTACNPFVRALIGGPTRLHVEATVDGEIADADFEVLLRSIRRAMGDAGHMSVFARTLSWSSTGNERRVAITVSSRSGRTTVTIGERLGPLIGGIFGGVGGGLGGGGSAGAVALAQKLFGNGSIGIALVGWLAATYGIARTIYSVTVKRRERRHHALLAELVSLVGNAATPPGQLADASPGSLRLPR
ncbi:MAG TPA: serine/threonine-protein kinase [Gemmatimonadaceae bacterium]|nr:serine/threonine-protein kinase [Gemmatimonadaceae bacterium]